jgi:hypothetical protein
MIYEMRTYRLRPGTLAEVERRFARAYRHRRAYSPLAACWHTEIGRLDEIVHVWPYADLSERARVRAAAYADPQWPPRIQPFLVHMRSEILVPLPFVPPLGPGRRGPVYELCSYELVPGALPGLLARWQSARGPRRAPASLVLAGVVDLGEVNRVIQVWAYRSLAQRAASRARQATAALGTLPEAALVARASAIMRPSAFSPLQ